MVGREILAGTRVGSRRVDSITAQHMVGLPAHPTKGVMSGLDALLEAAPRSPLGPGTPHAAAREALAAIDVDALAAGRRVVDREMAQGAVAGLWLRHNYLDESHEISQGLSDRAGAYWHGMMHRREPDPGNAKYWFRRVGRHAIFAELATVAAALAGGDPQAAKRDFAGKYLLAGDAWDAMAWIDLCDAARRQVNGCESLCEAIQAEEWRLLFEHSCRQAFGG